MLTSTDMVAGPESRDSHSLTDGLVSSAMVDELMGRVRTEGIELLSEGGLLSELTKRLLERAMDEELTDHLGY